MGLLDFFRNECWDLSVSEWGAWEDIGFEDVEDKSDEAEVIHMK